MNCPVIIAFDEKFDLHINSVLAAQGNHLFNEPGYFRLHSRSEKDCYAQLVRRYDQRVLATLSFHAIANGIFVSPGRGTYGGLSLNAEIELQVLDRFVAAVVMHLRTQGARSVRGRCAPASNGKLRSEAENEIVPDRSPLRLKWVAVSARRARFSVERSGAMPWSSMVPSLRSTSKFRRVTSRLTPASTDAR